MATLHVAGNLSAHDRQILTSVNAGASSLSFVGSSFIVLCYILFKELRKFSFKLVFYLALSDMLCSFFSIVGDPSKGFFCIAQGYSTHFFCVASFLWTTTIAFTLHRTVVKHKADIEDLEAMFHLYVWGTSLVMTVIRSIGNNHGHLGAWCWTETGRTRKAIHFITFYAPLWSAILYNGLTYFQVIRMLNNATHMAVGLSDRAYQFDARPDFKYKIECNGCGGVKQWIIHNVCYRSKYHRFCTNCVLKNHKDLFCPFCFQVYDESLPPHEHLMCLQCPSISHLSCVPLTYHHSPPFFLCPACSEPNSPFFNLDSSNSGTRIDKSSALALVAATRIAAISLAEAAAVARVEAKKKVKEASIAKKRAKEGLERLAYLAAKEQDRDSKDSAFHNKLSNK